MSIPKPTIELLLDAKAKIAEGPFYDENTNQLLWVDIGGKTLNFLDIDTKQNRCVELADHAGVALPIEHSQKLVALMGKSVCLVDRETGASEEVASVELDKPNNAFNDGKCDRRGRLWCGTMEKIMKWEGNKPAMPTPNQGALYSYTKGQIVKHVSDITVSNGMAWSPDGSRMYYIDTAPAKVYAFDYNEQEGTVSNQQVCVDYMRDKTLGFPDGMCTDMNGRLWVCGFYGPGVTCFDPQTGKQLAQVDLPVYNATSCCFGGPNHDWLFVTSASFATDEEEWVKYPHSGGIFVVKGLGAKGMAPSRFVLGQ